MHMKEFHVSLNGQLASWTVIYTKLHNYHWYVTGSNFFTLHEKFESLYTEAAGYIDEIAERILTIGGKPVGTLKECLELSSIKEAEGSETADDMIRTLLEDFKTLNEEINEIIEKAQEVNDEATSDLFLGIKSSLEQNIWMFNAYIG